MSLLWPGFLVLLGLIPALVAAYVWVLRRRRRFAVRYSSLMLVRQALPHRSWLRQHLPFVLFLLALIGLIMALARPVTIVSVPTGRANIILAMDVSRSMCSNDIAPNRLVAAQAAALSFVESQEANTYIGLVAFAGFAELILPPTTDTEVLGDAINSLTTGRRTAIGSAILEALDAIAEIDGSVAPVSTSATPGLAPTPVPAGAYAPSIIVLLTDGASNRGPWPLDAAQQAVDRGVRIYTIGFGTDSGGMMECGPTLDPFGGGEGQFWGGGGGGFRREIDEETLIQIAEMTGGDYYAPESADELQGVFRDLPTYLITRHETMEISVAFTAIGALLAGLAVVFSLLWQPLP
ncbi:MAG TPA: VWA domain-containing protein [Anaerolineae bacterium]|nr:VWA domain-containing protein [Anaerolineae bacterium]HMR67742.1 VWA domain-containing protein [Anaerolineae bacterium]